MINQNVLKYPAYFKRFPCNGKLTGRRPPISTKQDLSSLNDPFKSIRTSNGQRLIPICHSRKYSTFTDPSFESTSSLQGSKGHIEQQLHSFPRPNSLTSFHHKHPSTPRTIPPLISGRGKSPKGISFKLPLFTGRKIRRVQKRNGNDKEACERAASAIVCDSPTTTRARGGSSAFRNIQLSIQRLISEDVHEVSFRYIDISKNHVLEFHK